MKRSACALLILWPAALMAGSSADYNLSPATADSGGLHASSASYLADFSEAPGAAGSSAAYTSRSGYAGQLDEASSLVISLNPAALPETGNAQLGASLLSQAGFLTSLPAGGVNWSILSGPLTGVSSGGLVTAGKVSQSTTATVQGVASGITGTLSFQVLDSLPDNFGFYAGDGLPDWWQLQYLGLSESAGGQSGDPDHDGLSNLMEYAFGTDPQSSGTGTIVYSGGVLVTHGQPLPVVTNIPNSVDYRVIFSRRRDYQSAGLRYQVQFSPDLLAWTTSAVIPLSVAQDAEYEAVGVQWPFFINGRKARFFRILIDFPSSP